MAAIVYQTNKKTGVTYAYESISYWDKKKQQSRAKRKCIGRVDPETQKIIPTRKRRKPVVVEKVKRGPVPTMLIPFLLPGITYWTAPIRAIRSKQIVGCISIFIFLRIG